MFQGSVKFSIRKCFWLGMACPREKTGSHLITKVKSCWAGSISGWVTILVFLCCMPGEVRLASCSTLVPPTSAIVCGLSFSWSQPALQVFLWVLWFSSLSEIDSSQNTSGLGAVPWDHTWPIGSSYWGAFHMHSADPVELHPFQFSPQAASKGD